MSQESRPNPFAEVSEARLGEMLAACQSRAQHVYATKDELAAVVAAQSNQNMDIYKLQTELQGIRKSLDKLTAGIDRIVWVVVLSVVAALLSTVIL